MEDLDIDPKAEALIKIICNYLSGALQSSLDEVEEKESSFQEVDTMEIIHKHISNRLTYMESEGWIKDWTTAI
jgi:hypothetical protein